MKKAILMATFGSSVPEAQRVFQMLDTEARNMFADAEVRWAYTSRIIRKKLGVQGQAIDSPEMTLARLMDEGYTHVAVLSLHTIPGKEFHDLCKNARLFGQMSNGFERIVVARPLLSSHEDISRTARAMLEHIPKSRTPSDAVILMGHGSLMHPADTIYAAMNYVLADHDRNVHVASVQGQLTLADILPKLAAGGIQKVFLMPLMSVAGTHVLSDMAGDGPESWKSILTRNGYQCETVLAGTLHYPEIRKIWLDHLRSALAQFDLPPASNSGGDPARGYC